MVSLIDVKCNNKNNPIGVSSNPVFSYKILCDFSYFQTHYKIVVFDDKSVLWDSGIVESTKTCGISYNGLPLESTKTYHVIVSSFGINALTNEKVAVSNDELYFETGLLNGFKAKWVGMPAHFAGSALYARNIKYLDSKVKKARAYFCGIGYSEIYINEKKFLMMFFLLALPITLKELIIAAMMLPISIKKAEIPLRFGLDLVGLAEDNFYVKSN